MGKVVYYVAVSLDGYIAGEEEDISAFVASGDGVDRYQMDLREFDTVIMGRKTYEIGYKYGLEPGQPGYPHMKHYIVSDTLEFDKKSDQITIIPVDKNRIKEVVESVKGDIYLCGGGQLGRLMLDNGMIDKLILKVNPIVLGDGVPLFAKGQSVTDFVLKDSGRYDEGLLINEYEKEK